MTHADEQIQRRTRIRIVAVGGLMGLGFLVVAARAVQLHVSPDASLQGVAQQQHHAVIPMAKKRGKLLDAKGRELAVSVPIWSIFADPTAIIDPVGTLEAIEAVLPLGAQRHAILQRLQGEKRFAWIQRRVVASVADAVRAMQLPGIHFIEESRRIYPNGELASHILGAVGYDAEPLAGLELAYDKFLGSKRGDMVYQRDARGRVFFTPTVSRRAASSAATDPDDVGTMTLTIDKIIQYITEKALHQAMERTQAVGGMALVVEVHSGRILAMANWPQFNPNQYWDYPQGHWRNRAVTDGYEPGSTFKVLVVAAAIEAGMSPERQFDCERGALRVGRAVLHDSHPHGVLSVADIVQVSSNIGAAKIAQQVGKASVYEMLQRFGIGERTGIDFPGEVSGVLRPMSQWQDVEFATIAFGQGMAATPLQLTMAFAAMANGGALYRPYLVERIIGDAGDVRFTQAAEMRRQVMRPETAAVMRALMQRVVQPGGTGGAAASSLYTTAGKTGTAQKVMPGAKGYAAGKYFSSFVGFAPAETPRIAVFVGIDEPKGSYYGGAVAAPVFREVVEATLQYLEVPPRNAPVILAQAPEVPTTSPQAMAAQRELRTQTHEFVAHEGGRVQIPNLAGLSMREVVRLAKEVPLDVRVQGSGMVVAQRPAAGEVVSSGRAVEVEFQLPE